MPLNKENKPKLNSDESAGCWASDHFEQETLKATSTGLSNVK